ncbi:MAG: S8 family serine peptidase [Candidatus Pacebacteria bacterium]|nr:S8 family serine peptidase [Candidatus Paceibacterota bacterium]
MIKYTQTKRIIAGIALVALLPIQTLAFSFADARKDMRQDNLEKKDTLLIERSDRISQIRSRAPYKNDTIVVQYKNDTKRFRTINIPSGITVSDAIKQYQGFDNVRSVEPDYIAYADMVPNDPYYSPYQWHLDNDMESGINTEEAWDITTGSPDVIVAVIDTGIAYERYYDPYKRALYYRAPDLANTCFVAGYDFINNDAHPNDDEGHGTHVAGTIAQSTNNNKGVAGIAYETCVMPVKALNSFGSGSYTTIANAIYYAVDHGANIINMSLGGSASSTVLEDAVAYAYNNGVTVFAAAGNNGNDLPHYPSSYNDYVISVGATNYTKELPSYSTYGADVDIVAPGGDLSVDANGDGYIDGVLQQTFAAPNYRTFGYYFYQGTSMASPHAAGIAALLITNNTAETPDDIRAALETTAQDLGSTGKDYYFANGLVDAAAALAWTAGPLPNQVPIADAGDDQALPDSDGNGNEVVTLDGSASYDSDGSIVNYRWQLGSTTIATSSVATVTAYTGTTYYALTVTDDEGAQASDTITIVIAANQAPTANAGDDQSVMDSNDDGFESVTLDGNLSSDEDGTIVNYEWKEGTTILSTNATVTSDFAIGNHTVTLTVTDNGGKTASDQMIITVEQYVNQIPIANAGEDQTVNDNDGTGTENVTLDGSLSSDSDGTITHEWKEGTVVLGTGYIITSNFTTGEHTVVLTVTDDKGAIASDTVVITVQPNEAPTADAGVDQIVTIGDTVFFDGSSSSDVGGTITSYLWDFNGEDTSTEISPSYIFATKGVKTVTLTVTDNGDKTGTDTMTVNVQEASTEVEVFFDSFEVSEWNGLWVEDYQNDWHRSTQRAIDGLYSAEVDGRAVDAALTSTDINLQGKTNTVITFDWFIEYGLDFGEYITFDISTDGGITWTEQAQLQGNVDTENIWHNETIEVNNINNLELRFKGKMSNSREDANIDNVRVIAR